MEQNTPLPPDKINALKSLIHDHLRSKDVYSEIRRFLSSYLSSGQAEQGINEASVVEALNERGIIQDIIRSLGRPADLVGAAGVRATAGVTRESAADPSSSRRFVYMRILGGRAFTDELVNQDSSVSTMQLHLHFRSQRFQSRPVPSGVEPPFDEAFMIDMNPPNTNHIIEVSSLLRENTPFHLVVTRTDAEGTRSLVGSHFLEWRKVLMTGSLAVSVELAGVGADQQIPVGLLEMRLELLPRPEEALSQDEIEAQVKNDRLRALEGERLFLNYAKGWWQEYLQIRVVHQKRLIKIFAQAENGANRCVCNFVRPLSAGRLINSPFEAGRFVSLLPFEREETIGGGRSEVWHTTHSFLCKGRGDCEDHALLLCGLLLGFGLDAYVVVGTDTTGDHVWVMTRVNPEKVLFWEPLTGQRFLHQKPHSPTPAHRFRTVSCVFNDSHFFANNQPDDSVIGASFDLESELHWKAMRSEQITALTTYPEVPLRPYIMDPLALEDALEQQLRALVQDYRSQLQVVVVWDPKLSYILTPALAAYEMERVHGVLSGNDELQQSIKKVVPDGHTFRGFPIQFSHRSAARMFPAMLRAPVCQEILRTRGDSVRFGLRVKIFPYPEDAASVWVMLAVKYRQVLAS
eukprot:gnl/Spiro4/22113_TR10881_c0_g1_i1.p1 gnl/Spiro4/22113_TR10881_c0_g1~~gnl/Spiro4/22113_TR10881_c0_g1_i1.p1  ORF type:complete len:654 (-),score=146.58 gnl/Spiro4/22113_TR10881_c0_g1_i1:127-2022(-)